MKSCSHQRFWLVMGVSLLVSNNLAFASDGNTTDLYPVNFVASPSQTTAISGTQGQTKDNQNTQNDSQATQNQDLAELQITAGYDLSPSSSVNGGPGYSIGSTLYSSRIQQNWRLFAGENFSYESEPNNEANVNLSRTMAGVEYQNASILASAAPTYNNYNGNQRVGAMGSLTWTIDDQWSLGGSSQLFSSDIPLRALDFGITANSYEANATWHQGEQRSLRVDSEVMTFSDDNIRTSLTGDYTERLYAVDSFTIDGLIKTAASQNTKNDNNFYYDPSVDFFGLVGARITQPLYQQSNINYEHSLEITPGGYWQKDYGGSPAVNVRYEQRVTYNKTFEAGLGIDLSRQSYDGSPENDVAFLFDLTERF